ncbi:MAG TPA: TetR/AcrR family transcriptional regulator [Casimicrobiaceae bacterium]|nr:TetR/AcrR family transcriptional regulator [Casimicrobiaceae bacterium]
MLHRDVGLCGGRLMDFNSFVNDVNRVVNFVWTAVACRLPAGKSPETSAHVMATRPSAGRSAARKADAGVIRAQILAAASEEFAARGLNGARLDMIAKSARTTRAMIYYYFGGREALYLAALEEAYRNIRAAERELDITHMPPVPAMRRLIEFVFDYYQAHPAFVALVVTENQNGGRYIRKSRQLRRINVSIIDTLRAVLDHGAQEGVFRPGIDAIDVHLAISALGFFQVANRWTFSYLFRRDLRSPAEVAKNRAMVVEIVLRYLAAAAARTEGSASGG